MEENNPYRDLSAPPAAFAAVTERATFLKKVYGILFLGVLGFAATLWAAANVEPVRDVAMGLARVIYGSRWGWLIYVGLFMGGSMAVHAVAERRPLNAIAFAAWVVLLGFLIAPVVLMVSEVRGPAIVSQASAVTALVFGGLTVFVFFTGKDFSWLRGILWLGGISLLVVGLIGWIGGFSVGLWFSWAIVVLMAGYILYDTSAVLHHLPTTMAMSGAVMLFTDVVLLFKHVLVLLSNRD